MLVRFLQLTAYTEPHVDLSLRMGQNRKQRLKADLIRRTWLRNNRRHPVYICMRKKFRRVPHTHTLAFTDEKSGWLFINSCKNNKQRTQFTKVKGAGLLQTYVCMYVHIYVGGQTNICMYILLERMISLHLRLRVPK